MTQPTWSDRGFARFEPVPGRLWGEQVRLYESSLATQACVWLAVQEPVDRNAAARGEQPDVNEAVIELTLEELANLRDRIDWFLSNHYHLPEASRDRP